MRLRRKREMVTVLAVLCLSSLMGCMTSDSQSIKEKDQMQMVAGPMDKKNSGQKTDTNLESAVTPGQVLETVLVSTADLPTAETALGEMETQPIAEKPVESPDKSEEKMEGEPRETEPRETDSMELVIPEQRGSRYSVQKKNAPLPDREDITLLDSDDVKADWDTVVVWGIGSGNELEAKATWRIVNMEWRAELSPYPSECYASKDLVFLGSRGELARSRYPFQRSVNLLEGQHMEDVETDFRILVVTLEMENLNDQESSFPFRLRSTLLHQTEDGQLYASAEDNLCKEEDINVKIYSPYGDGMTFYYSAADTNGFDTPGHFGTVTLQPREKISADFAYLIDLNQWEETYLYAGPISRYTYYFGTSPTYFYHLADFMEAE